MSCPRFVVTAYTNEALLPPSRGLSCPHPLNSMPSATFHFNMAYCWWWCYYNYYCFFTIIIILQAEMDISESYVLKETRTGQ